MTEVEKVESNIWQWISQCLQCMCFNFI